MPELGSLLVTTLLLLFCVYVGTCVVTAAAPLQMAIASQCELDSYCRTRVQATAESGSGMMVIPGLWHEVCKHVWVTAERGSSMKVWLWHEGYMLWNEGMQTCAGHSALSGVQKRTWRVSWMYTGCSLLSPASSAKGSRECFKQWVLAAAPAGDQKFWKGVQETATRRLDPYRLQDASGRWQICAAGDAQFVAPRRITIATF